MENTLLDMCVGMSQILTYLYKKGVISVYGDPWMNTGKIHLNEAVFKEIFPDVVQDDDGFAHAEYKGVNIVAIFPQEIKP